MWANSPKGGNVTTDSAQTLTNKTLILPNLNENVAVTATATEINPLHNGAIYNNTSLIGLTDVQNLRIGGVSSSTVNKITSDSAGVMLYVDDSPVPVNIPPNNRISNMTVNVQLTDSGVKYVTPSQANIIKNGDTTVVKVYGKMIFRVADSSLYVCKFIKPTGKKCWYKIQ